MNDSNTELAAGIDLGTTFSVVAHIDANGRPWTVMNSEGDLTTPSVVFFDKKSVVVGKEAVKVAEYEPERIAQFVKRDMGRDKFRKQIRGEELPPEVVQALILKKLKEDTELKLGALSKVVITVRAYFNEPMRQATQVAGKIAGLEVLDIINEPTAAAISFGVQQGFLNTSGESTAKETILVYDLGGGTFDATIMTIEGQNYKALATLGDVYLGGIDWDRRIVDHIAESFKEEHDVDPRDDPAGLQTLLQEAEDAKHALSAREETTIRYAFNGQRVAVTLTRSEFETMTGDLLDRTMMTLRKLLREVKLEWKDITRLLLVGGSSRMPMIHEMLESESGLAVDRSLSPDEAVAHGAAIYASLLLGSPEAQKMGMSVSNVNSHDLGVLGVEASTGMKRRQIMIPRNTALPATGVRKFKTFKENQRSVAVNVVEGGDASGNNATQIGKCVVKDLPNLPAKTPVEVIFKYSENGMLTVAAWLPTIKKKAALEIERSSGLPGAQLTAWADRVQQGLTDESVLKLSEPPKVEATQPEEPAAEAKAKQTETQKPKAEKAKPKSANEDTAKQPQSAAKPKTKQAKPAKPAAAEAAVAAAAASVAAKASAPAKPKPVPQEAASVSASEPPSTTAEVQQTSPEIAATTAATPPPAPAVEAPAIEEPQVAVEPSVPAEFPEPAIVAREVAQETPSEVPPIVEPAAEAVAELPTITEPTTTPEPVVDELPSVTEPEPTSAEPPVDAAAENPESEPSKDATADAKTTTESKAAESKAVSKAASKATAKSDAKSKAASAAAGKKDGEKVSLVVREKSEEEEAWEARQARIQQLKVLGINTGLHLVALLVLAAIILPAKAKESFEVISSRMPTEDIEEDFQEEMEIEQPEEIEPDTKMEVVNDIVSDSNETMELDISDLEPSSIAPDPLANAPAPVAKITGEMGGRSKAGKTALVNKYGGNAQSEAAVGYGLKWLSRHQLTDGSWSFDHTGANNCDCDQPGKLAQTRQGATAMALMTFLGAGHTYYSGTFHKNVTAGLNFIMNNGKMTENGADFRGVAEANSGMYVQGIVTIALCEALAMNDVALKLRTAKAKRRRKKDEEEETNYTISYKEQKETSERLRPIAQAAINFIAYAQAEDGGWRYQLHQKGDTSVVGWQVMALISGRSAHLRIPPTTLQGVNVFLATVQADKGAFYGYDKPGKKPSTTAIGLLCRMYLGWKRSNPNLKRGIEFLSKTEPSKNDSYYNYYATQTMHQWGGDEWKKWNEVMRDQLINTQVKTGHEAGSWKVTDGHGGAGGRLYSTCLATMTLEVYYRHLPLYDHLDKMGETTASAK